MAKTYADHSDSLIKSLFKYTVTEFVQNVYFGGEKMPKILRTLSHSKF